MAGERVLLVDDEEGIRQLLSRLLVRQGYEVATADSGAAAYRVLDERAPHLCVVDLRLPDASGIDILRHVRERHPDCEVIILTGFGDLSSAVEALRLGAYDYLQKPLPDLQLLTVAVNRALERQRLSRHNAQLIRDLTDANEELEARRRQQLQYIHYIGQAMAGALRSEEVIQVLLRSVLEATACDGAGVLVLAGQGEAKPWALLRGRAPLGPTAQRELLAALVGQVPVHLCPTTEEIALRDPDGQFGEAVVDDATWGTLELATLSALDEVQGTVALARHDDRPFSEENLGFFGILVTQAAAALANARLFTRTHELATRDSLTGLYNRRHFGELLEAEISRAERYGQEFAVIMVDLDRGEAHGLKAINDTYGHQAGDEFLNNIARFLQRTVRRADVVARYGGDEFVILSPQTRAHEALSLATRVCRQLGQTPIRVVGREVRASASVGAAVFHPASGDTAAALIARADKALYRAKELGGNQPCLYDAAFACEGDD